MGLLDYFKDYMKPTPTQQMTNFANALRPAPPPMLARPAPAPKTVYTAPRVAWAPQVRAAPAAPVYQGPTPQQQAASAQAAAQKKAESEAKARSRRENQATKALVNQQVKLSGAFGKQRDTKLRNISTAFTTSDSNLRKGYGQALGGLRSSAKDNDKSEGDSSFQNIANAVRERQDIIGEIGNNGGGETDMLRGQLAALRNYSANQGEINRSFFDTLNSINRSITSLNVDTTTGRNNLWNQAESDRESAWANYYNQQADTWTQITNIENSNNNTKSSTSEAYKKTQTDAGNKAARYAGSSYAKKNPSKLDTWSGKGTTEKRKPTSVNAAATVNLGGPMKRAEGATLRKW
jgi:DNA-binding protein H-NS